MTVNHKWDLPSYFLFETKYPFKMYSYVDMLSSGDRFINIIDKENPTLNKITYVVKCFFFLQNTNIVLAQRI